MNTKIEKEWIYIPDYFCEHREVLGTVGKNPLIVIGVNPSTAEPNNLDPTLKSVERIARSNGFDSFIMFNLYPQRATKPDNMDLVLNTKYHKKNLQEFENILSKINNPSIWIAWGDLINKRKYLKKCRDDLINIAINYGSKFYMAGILTKNKNPRHPLYLKRDIKLQEFNM